ncbi:SpoIIE family protein phosphatase [Desulfoplanes sp.]
MHKRADMESAPTGILMNTIIKKHSSRRTIKGKILGILMVVLVLSLVAHLGIFYYTTAHVKKMNQEVLSELHALDNKAGVELKNEIENKFVITDIDICSGCIAKNSNGYIASHSSDKKWILFPAGYFDQHVEDKAEEKSVYLLDMKEKFVSFYNRITSITLAVFIGIVVIAYVIGSTLAKKLTEPLITLKKATRFLGEGYLADKVDVRTGDEIEELADNFNQMVATQDNYLDKLCDSIERKTIMESEIQLAARIQKSSLPGANPAFDAKTGVDVSAFLKPTKMVSGDFYDYFFVDDNHLFFALGDVSGKSMSAALFMMTTKLLMKKFALTKLPPDAVLKYVNDTLALDNPTCMYCTIFCGILDTETGHLNYCNGGHTYPLLCSNTSFSYMATRENMLVGLTPEAEFGSEELDMHENDMLFVYSDGVTEAKNTADDLYSEPRLLEQLNGGHKETARRVIEEIREDVLGFSKNAEQYDDITMLCLAFRGKGRVS